MQWKALFTGDVVCRQSPPDNWLSPEFVQFMQLHAVRSCNFEAPVQGKGMPIRKAGPHLSQHPGTPAILESAGFNIINLANNHIYDYGPQALSATIAAFANATCVGAGKNFEEAYALQTISVQGIQVGLLSFCEAEFGALTISRRNDAGYAWINHPVVSGLVMDARKKTDVLLIQVHAGVEQTDVPLPEWRARYRELIELGADAVIGSHPHVPQGWEIYKGRPIFYSLGNFWFDSDSNHALWNTGIVISLSFNDAAYTGFEVMGIKKEGLQIVPCREEWFSTHLATINNLLEEPLYTDTINKLAQTLWQQYYRSYYDYALKGIHTKVSFGQVLKTFIKRLFLKKHAELDSALLLHNIRIESHRWIVERVLEANNH